MADAQPSETTLLLRAWAEGDQAALDRLTPRVYAELRRIAGHCMQNERPGRTLQTTALVHEAYLRLIDVNNVDWEHRAHFFAVSAQIMRRILVDGARARAAGKRGGGMPRVNLDEIADVSSGRGNELIALDEALERLEQSNPRLARVVECRYFAGYTEAETATAMGVTERTVQRDWARAKALLYESLGAGA